MHRHSLLQSSITLNALIFLPVLNESDTLFSTPLRSVKSIDQVWFILTSTLKALLLIAFDSSTGLDLKIKLQLLTDAIYTLIIPFKTFGIAQCSGPLILNTF